jgi:hypothetical protein
MVLLYALLLVGVVELLGAIVVVPMDRSDWNLEYFLFVHVLKNKKSQP